MRTRSSTTVTAKGTYAEIFWPHLKAPRLSVSDMRRLIDIEASPIFPPTAASRAAMHTDACECYDQGMRVEGTRVMKSSARIAAAPVYWSLISRLCCGR